MSFTEVSYKLTLTIGTMVLTVQDDDGPPDPDAVQIVDGLWAATAVADDQLWPAQETDTAGFSLYAPNAGLLAGVVKQAPVIIRMRTPRDAFLGYELEMRGRVSDAVLRSHRQGCVMEVTVTDYRTSDLGELTVGDSPWPLETVKARMDRIFDELGLTLVGNAFEAGSPGDTAQVRAVDVDAQPALSLIGGYLDTWVADEATFLASVPYVDPNLLSVQSPGYTLARKVLRPTVWDANGDVSEWYLVTTYGASYPAGPPWADTAWFDLPADFGDTGGGEYGVVLDTDPAVRAPQLVDGAYVDLASASYTQKRAQQPNRVGVSYWTTGGTVERVSYRSNGVLPAVTARFPSDLVTAADSARAASLYLPDPGGTDWYADTFTWRWGRDPFASDGVRVPVVGDPCTVAPVQDRHSPLERPWYTGIVTARTFTFDRANPVMSLTVRPQLRKLFQNPQSWGLRWDDIPAGVTWDELNTRDTWDDYRLIRRP